MTKYRSLQATATAVILTAISIASAQNRPLPLPPASSTPAGKVARPALTPTPIPANLFRPLQANPLPFATQMHGTAVVGSRLYVFGGNIQLQGWGDTVWAAEIQANGSLGPWTAQRPLPERRAYATNSVQVVNSRIYIIGGSVADDRSTTDTNLRNVRDAIYTEVQPDGQLGPWQRSREFPGEPRSLSGTANNGKMLYVVGGAFNRKPHDNVIAASLNADGSLGEWHEVAKLPVPLWYNGAAILDTRLYVWGGLTGGGSQTASSRVWSAEIAADGSIMSWTEETPLPEAIYSSAFCGFNDHLVCVGGRYTGATWTSDVWFTQLRGGRVEKWTKLATDLDTQCYHSLGLDESRGWIFVTGGRHRDVPANNNSPNHFVSEVRGFKIDSPTKSAAAATSTGDGDPLSAAGFTTLAAATAAATPSKPVLVYFRSPEVPACSRFESSIITSAEFRSFAANFTLAVVDVSKDTRTSYKYSIFKVPSLAVLDASGALVRSATGLRTTEDLKKISGR